MLLWLALCAALSPAQPIQILNHTGGVSIRMIAGQQPQLRTKAGSRPPTADDVTVTRDRSGARVECRPADGARIDLEIDLPYGLAFRAETRSGPIELHGLAVKAHLVTETGDVKIAAPWMATRFEASLREEPRALRLPKKPAFSRAGQGRQMSDRLDPMRITYGFIRVEAGAPGVLELEDIEIPEDSPVKMPWQAAAILERLLAPPNRAKAPPQAGTAPAAAAASSDLPVFRSDVRLVALNVAVTDAQGAPITDLTAADFEVLEDGVAQKIENADRGQTPLNLAVLLDLSGSTRRDRPAMIEATRRFLGIARPEDRVALYALAENLFRVVSRLTPNRERLQAVVEAIPEISGGSPVYDCIVLGYAEEFLARPNERNALIVITDGIDNQIYGIGTPSEVSFRKLRQAADGMHALIYPILLDPYDKVPAPGWAKTGRKNLEALAGATGGRLFVSRSIRDLDPVYSQVEQELRGVYSLSYYPSNQEFQGAWRRLEVKTRKPAVRVRARQGYFAK